MFIVETEYLFVNLKWNQIPETEDIEHREPIQIGIVAADENLQKEKIFSKAIRLSDPTHINKDALKLYRTTLENIMNANTKEDIFADADILKAVSDEVKKLMDKDPLLEADENQELKRKMNGYLERGWEKVNL